MDVDDTIFIQRPKMDGLFRQSRKFAHLNIGAAHQVDVLQRARAQFEQLEGERVFLRLSFLCHIAQ